MIFCKFRSLSTQPLNTVHTEDIKHPRFREIYIETKHLLTEEPTPYLRTWIEGVLKELVTEKTDDELNRKTAELRDRQNNSKFLDNLEYQPVREILQALRNNNFRGRPIDLSMLVWLIVGLEGHIRLTRDLRLDISSELHELRTMRNKYSHSAADAKNAMDFDRQFKHVSTLHIVCRELKLSQNLIDKVEAHLARIDVAKEDLKEETVKTTESNTAPAPTTSTSTGPSGINKSYFFYAIPALLVMLYLANDMLFTGSTESATTPVTENEQVADTYTPEAIDANVHMLWVHQGLGRNGNVEQLSKTAAAMSNEHSKPQHYWMDGITKQINATDDWDIAVSKFPVNGTYTSSDPAAVQASITEFVEHLASSGLANEDNQLVVVLPDHLKSTFQQEAKRLFNSPFKRIVYMNSEGEVLQ